MSAVALKRNGVHCYKIKKFSGVEKQNIEHQGHVDNSGAPVGFWTFEESSGTASEDYSESGTDHDADTSNIAAHSTTYYAAGSRSVTLSSGDRVELTHHADFNWGATSKWTVSSYTSTVSTSYVGVYVKRLGSGSTYRGVAIFVYNGLIDIYIIDTYGTPGAGDKSIHVRGQNSCPNIKEAGVYHHVLVTYDGSANASGVTAWIDGTKCTTGNSNLGVVSSHDTLGTSDTVTNTVNPSLGNDTTTTSLNSGGVDHTTIWNGIEINDSQAAAIYNSGTPIDCRRGL